MLKKIMISFLFCLVLTGVIVSAADKVQGDEQKKEDKVVARIDGTPIYFSEVEKRVDNFEKKFQEVNPAMKLPEEKRVKMRQDFLDRMVREKILELAAAKKNYTVTDAEIDERISQLQKIFGEGEEAKKRFLNGISNMQEFRDNISRQIKIDKFIEEEQKKSTINVSADEVKKYYEDNSEKFQQKESVRLSQITWRVPPAEDPSYAEKLKTAMEQAEQAMQEAQTGVDFGDLVKKYSQDKKMIEKLGDIGFIQRGQMMEQLENTAFALSTGEVSKPVKTQFGVFLLKATDKQEARMMKFDEVKEKIESGLLRKKQGSSREKIYQDLKSNTKVEVLL